MLFGPVEDVPAILDQQINGEMVREAALRTEGSCGPSGLDALIISLLLTTRRERDVRLDDKLEDLRNSLPEKTKRAVDLAAEKGASSWLTVIPVKENGLKSPQERILKMQPI